MIIMQLNCTLRSAIKSANVYGITYGVTQSIMSFANSAIFSFGAYLIQNKIFNTDFQTLMTVFSVIIFGASSLGLKNYVFFFYSFDTH
jgi:hypothetical protein